MTNSYYMDLIREIDEQIKQSEERKKAQNKFHMSSIRLPSNQQDSLSAFNDPNYIEKTKMEILNRQPL